ncbi:hypothetical protein GTP91_24950 [Rugamonas sp. FT82W]|uniref:Serine dehydrogenase proteinase n=1 Tax=Duganella vulcania TaxID=2692166 RepID=A0A845GBZ5_9BURK|nr:hypothetical protein [Duganella vulcania]MYM90408.1 hypothetical protein [Duganella vulcania]
MSADLPAAIEALRRAQPGRDFLLVSASISRKLHRELSRLIAGGKQHAGCTVFLCTMGGDSDAGFRIGRCLQQHYEHIRLAIPSYCKSAGTLIAIGAHELAMGDLGELGPLDLQIMKPSELHEMGSVQDVMQALNAVEFHTREAFIKNLLGIRKHGHLSTKLAGKLAARVTQGIAAPLYSQMDPLRIGEIQRATRIVAEYGKRLNDVCNSLKSGALERLASTYPSHHFVIDRKEAEELFSQVHCLTQEELAICQILEAWLVEPIEQAPVFLNAGLDTKGENHESQDWRL